MRLLLLSLLLTGCVSIQGPDAKPLERYYRVIVINYDTLEEINKAWSRTEGAEGMVSGFAQQYHGWCVVHYLNNDWETFIHELKHCYYGAWH